MTRIFHWFFMWKMDLMSGCDIRLVFTLPPRDSTLQYTRCVHPWNHFPFIITLSESIPALKDICEHLSQTDLTVLVLSRTPELVDLRTFYTDLSANVFKQKNRKSIKIVESWYRVSQKTWEFSDKLDIVFVMN